jgi:hypothetical protein
MKTKLHIQAFLFACLLALAPLLVSCNGSDSGSSSSSSNSDSEEFIEGLSAEEIDDLLYMREEEKLARDVYITLYGKWGSSIFNNISNAEQRHMDTMLTMIEKYELRDPVTDNSVGAFVDAGLSNLYHELVAKGDASLLAALYVGALIEEIDILDLREAIKESDHNDLIQAYENLLKGSESHLRAFVAQIESQGDDYKAQEMSQADVDEILN